MSNPGQVNISSIQDALSHAMNTATTDADRWSLRSDAECHRDAILDALSFIGTALQDCTTSATRSGSGWRPQNGRRSGCAMPNHDSDSGSKNLPRVTPLT